jgi:hypothetical protein
MNTEMALTARRFALTFAAAGIAVLGSVVAAPAASAVVIQDGPSHVIDGPGNGNGPDAFIVNEHGREPVFYCEADKPKKQHKKCVEQVVENGPRF